MVNKLLTQSQKFFNQKSGSILSAAGIIAASYFGSALLGLIRNHLLAARFFSGFEGELDVYFAAFVIPDTIFQLLVAGAISAAFIPIYQEYFSDSEDKANHMANAALTSVTLILTLVSILVALFARPLAGLLAQYSDPKLDLLANLIRIMSLAQILFTISSFLTGVLQSQRRFLIPAIAPIMYNLGTILGVLFFSSTYGIYSAAYGVLFGALFHTLIQLPAAFQINFYPRFVFEPKNKGVLNMLKLMPPRTLALGLDQFEKAVAVNFTSVLAAGSLSIFNFARQLYILPISLFGVSLSQAAFPALSQEASYENKDKFKATLSKSILQIFFFALPASILILVLRIPLVRLAFGAKSFPWDATLLTGRALAVLAISIAPQAVVQTLTRALHALKDTKTPLITGIITMILFTVPAYFLTRVMNLNVVGVTLAISISNSLDFILLYQVIRHRVGPLGISYRILKMIAVSAISGLALWLPFRLLDQLVFDTTRTLPLIILTSIVSGIGFVVYLFFCWLFKVEELSEVIQIVKKLGNWRKVLASSDEVLETPTGE